MDTTKVDKPATSIEDNKSPNSRNSNLENEILFQIKSMGTHLEEKIEICHHAAMVEIDDLKTLIERMIRSLGDAKLQKVSSEIPEKQPTASGENLNEQLSNASGGSEIMSVSQSTSVGPEVDSGGLSERSRGTGESAVESDRSAGTGSSVSLGNFTAVTPTSSVALVDETVGNLTVDEVSDLSSD